jgi:carboxymethylenebutenolidase
MLTTENVDVFGSPMAVTMVQPDGAGPIRGGIVLCHHREGVDEFTLDAAKRLAEHGFVVTVPNFYHRRPPDEDWSVSRKAMQDAQVIADLKATYDFLVQQAFIRADAIGIVGHCMGGRTAFLGAAVIPLFKAAVILYGGNIFETEGQGMPAPITFYMAAAIM